MYNRYIPTENGGYRRQIVEERQPTAPPPQKPVPPPIQKHVPAPPAPIPAPKPKPQRTPPPRKPAPKQTAQPCSNDTLIRLLSGIDKGDLILLLILVLLLMDGETDNGTLLLTVALYFLLQ
ncbi:MAG: hypothetical protein IJP11_02605 [Oscillospiraceae bacterium]|nr:hypothetical protein [Oscillospiraceae bacterium]